MPRMLRNVSCWPANEASGRSSAVALDRTAKETSALSPASCSYAARMSASRSGGNGCPTIAALIALPTRRAVDVVGVQTSQHGVDQVAQPGLADEPPERVRRGGETVGDPHPGRGQLGAPSPPARSSCHRPARGRRGPAGRTSGRCRCMAVGSRWSWVYGWRRVFGAVEGLQDHGGHLLHRLGRGVDRGDLVDRGRASPPGGARRCTAPARRSGSWPAARAAPGSDERRWW